MIDTWQGTTGEQRTAVEQRTNSVNIIISFAPQKEKMLTLKFSNVEKKMRKKA